jgi:dethiobiotin synthetase
MSLNDPDQPGGISAEPDVGFAEPRPATAPVAVAVPVALAAEGVPTRFACFVTGTDTEIGKTLVSAAILHKLVQHGQRCRRRGDRLCRFRGADGSAAA